MSTREILPHDQGEGAYDMYASNPAYPGNSWIESNTMDQANDHLHPYLNQREEEILNAPVQHQLLWEQCQDGRGVPGPVISQKLCVMGGCVVLLVIVAVAVALGVTPAFWSSGCITAVDDAGQSDQFLQLSVVLGVSGPGSRCS
jgi:hypothetical protein